MTTALFIISWVFFIGYALLIFYYSQGWAGIPEYWLQNNSIEPSTKISVIVPARNEEKNIAACLVSILNQQYPPELFEVIIIDDHSTDRTAAIVSSFTNQNIKLISLKDFIGNKINSYKKKAIETAIEQSTGNLIITTDADCLLPGKWLATIARFYEQSEAAFIAGPVAYYGENDLIKKFESLDFMTMQGITGASVHKKFHTMCNGANVAYEKKVFYEVEGFKGIDTIASGDDMLLMHKIYKKYPARVFYLKSKDIIVQTKPAGTISAFFNQRIRWASKADQYDDKRIFWVLMLVYFFNLWFVVLGIFSIFHFQFLILLIGLLMAKIIVELIFLFPVSKFFKKSKLLWWFPLFQPLHILYIIIAGWLGKFGSYQWKERRVQ